MLTIYYVPLGGSVDEMKRVYRQQEEERFPGQFLQHLDERMHTVRIVAAKGTSFKELMTSAEDGSTIVVAGLRRLGISSAELVHLFEARRKDRLYLRLLEERMLLEPKDRATNAFLAGLLASSRGERPITNEQRLVSLAEARGNDVVEAMRKQRCRGDSVREIAKKLGVSRSSVHRYTRDIVVPPAVERPGTKVDIPKVLLAPAKSPAERLEQLLESFLLNQRKPGTAKAYRSRIFAYRAFCADQLARPIERLEDFTLETALAFKLHRLESGTESSTVAAELAALRSFLAFCVDQGEIAKSPLARLKSPKIDKQGKTLPVSRENAARLISTAEVMTIEAAKRGDKALWRAHRNCLEIYLLIGVGMRHSGLLALRKQDVGDHSGGKSLDIVSKATADRFNWGRLDERVAAAIESFIDSYMHDAPPSAYLFHARRDAMHKPLSIRMSNRNLAAIFERAGVAPPTRSKRPRRAHSLRVTWATFAYEGGANVRTIQKKMDHKNVDQTYGYLQIDDRDIDIQWLAPLKVAQLRAGPSH